MFLRELKMTGHIWIQRSRASLPWKGSSWTEIWGRMGAPSPQQRSILHERRSVKTENRDQGIIGQGPDYIKLLEHIKNFGHYPKCHNWPNKGWSRVAMWSFGWQHDQIPIWRHFHCLSYSKNISEGDEGRNEKTSLEVTAVFRRKLWKLRQGRQTLQTQRGEENSEIFEEIWWWI